jgi:quercetin dioxygenase-like cupin family protein
MSRLRRKPRRPLVQRRNQQQERRSMPLQNKPFAAGKLRGAVYTFEKVGDVLPMHRHTEADVHITVVARGSFRVHGPDIGDKEYSAGALLDWSAGVDHEFIALTDGARIVNIVKG